MIRGVISCLGHVSQRYFWEAEKGGDRLLNLLPASTNKILQMFPACKKSNLAQLLLRYGTGHKTSKRLSALPSNEHKDDIEETKGCKLRL